MVYRFRGFRLDPGRRRLEASGGTPIHLTPKAFDALVHLVERRGNVVSRRELTDALWPDTVVDENNLSQAVSAARRAVGRDCVATVPGRGYQFVADVCVGEEIVPDATGERAAGEGTEKRAAAAVHGAGWRTMRPRGISRLALPAAVALLLAVATAYLVMTGSPREDVPLRLAVLPFSDLSPGNGSDPWADGIPTELINVLGRIEGLEVTPATSSFHFRGRDVDAATIRDLLDVHYLLEGDVIVRDDRLRVGMRLSDGVSDSVIWNETFPTGASAYFPVDDYFMVQDTIAHEVAETLQATLGVGAIGNRLGMTRDARAFGEYLRAGNAVDVIESFDPGLYRTALGHLERAVEIDSGFSLAWLGIAQRYSDMRDVGLPAGELPAAAERAEYALSKVRALTPDLPELELFMLEIARDTRARSRDFVDLERRVERYAAAAKRYRYPTAERLNVETIFLRFVGRVAESLPLLERAYRLDPLSGRVAANLTFAYATIGDYAAAFEVADEFGRKNGGTNSIMAGQDVLIALSSGDEERIAERLAWFERNVSPDDLNVRMGKLLSRPERALAELRREVRATDDLPPTQLMLGLDRLSAWAAYFGDHELALQMKRRFLERGEGNVAEGFGFNVPLPLFAGMRRLERFKELAREVGLEAYWRATGRWSDYCRPVDARAFECF